MIQTCGLDNVSKYISVGKKVQKLHTILSNIYQIICNFF